MSVVYKLTAVECPLPIAPTSTILDPSDGQPVVATRIPAGSTMITPSLNANAVRLDLVGRWGGGGYAVATGLGISIDSGLDVLIGAGQAMLDGAISLADDYPTSAADDGRTHFWLLQSGIVTPVIEDLTQPETPAAYLGSVLAASGSITEIDYSGRLEIRGGALYRRTYDVGAPTDAPSSRLQFWNRTESGLYWWDGTRYWALSSSGIDPDSIKIAEGTLTVTLAVGESGEYSIDHSDQVEFDETMDFAISLEATPDRPGVRVTPLLASTDGTVTDGSKFCIRVDNVSAHA